MAPSRPRCSTALVLLVSIVNWINHLTSHTPYYSWWSKNKLELPEKYGQWGVKKGFVWLVPAKIDNTVTRGRSSTTSNYSKETCLPRLPLEVPAAPWNPNCFMHHIFCVTPNVTEQKQEQVPVSISLKWSGHDISWFVKPLKEHWATQSK
jgi:hypothetical protein